MLYTTKQIAEIYGGENENVTPYMITHTWIPNGLRYIKGKGKGFLFKKEWIEEYLESQIQTKLNKESKVMKIKKGTRQNIKNTCFVH